MNTEPNLNLMHRVVGVPKWHTFHDKRHEWDDRGRELALVGPQNVVVA